MTKKRIAKLQLIKDYYLQYTLFTIKLPIDITGQIRVKVKVKVKLRFSVPGAGVAEIAKR